MKQTIEVDVWNMDAGIITGFRFDGRLFIADGCCSTEAVPPQTVVEVEPEKILKTNVTGAVRKRNPNVIDKWILEKDVKRFKLQDFFKDYPQQFYHLGERINLYLSKMVADKTLVQMGKDEFVVSGQGVKDEKNFDK